MFCSDCNTQLKDSDRYCQSCGANQAINSNTKTGYGQSNTNRNRFRHSGFWKRFVAIIIDNIGLSLVNLVVALMLGPSAFDLHSPHFTDGEVIYVVASLFINFLYFTIMHSSSAQATVGKMILGMKVIDRHGNRISYPLAVGRWFADILSIITFGFGYIMASFTEYKQALHDIVCDTYVINK